MELVPSNDPAAGSDGLIKSHNFAAANTVIPTHFGLENQLAAVYKFIQSNKLRVTIDPPKGNTLVNHSTSVEARALQHDETLMPLYAGGSSAISVAISNIGVGHNFPAGTTDIQEAWLHFQVIGADGEIIFESGSEQHPGNSAAIYKSIPVNRHGKTVWRHDVFNMVGDTYKNLIKAGETDIVRIAFNIPGDTKGPVTLHAALKYKKFNDQYKNWIFEGKPFEIPVIEVARASLSIPVIIEPPSQEVMQSNSTGMYNSASGIQG